MTITASVTTQQATSYVGQTWYDFMGNPLDETGHASPAAAAERIAVLDKQLAGRWCFAVIKTKIRENAVDRWVTAVLFPDGKVRKLMQGEVSISQKTKGKFLSLEQVKMSAEAGKVKTEIRRAPDTRFPWHSGAAEAKLERFSTMLDVEKWLIKNNRPESIIFVFEPGTQVRAPDEEMLFAYLGVVAK